VGRQVNNVAWKPFLLKGLEFTSRMYGITIIAGSVMTYAGLVAYNR
jgi:hypothetical protein